MSLEDAPASGPPPPQSAMVAVDLGAESCRVSLLRWIEGRPHIAIVHRFSNGPVSHGNEIRWNLKAIVAGVEEGLRRSAELAREGIASIAVDGWAADYVRLTDEGLAAADPFCYRDSRTIAAEQSVHDRIDARRLYTLTGAQRLRFNTVYQLHADAMAGIPAERPWINLPEYVLYRLGGRRVAEYTNATHTALVSVTTKGWCTEVFEALGLDPAAAPELVPPGTDIGALRGPLAELPPLRSTRLIAPACHDTASAVAGIPRSDDHGAYISSGTWSLVGALLDRACATEQAFQKDFTNLGSASGRVCFHKNVNGMWLLRQCMDHWATLGADWSVDELVARADRLGTPEHVFDVDDEDLMLPGNMPARINRQRERMGLQPLSESPENAPAFANLIFHSLAARYAEVLKDVAEITGKQLRELDIVGGGSRNALLNRLTENATGLKVRCGYVESATIGNLAIQLAVLHQTGGRISGPKAEEISRWARALGAAAQASVDAKELGPVSRP